MHFRYAMAVYWTVITLFENLHLYDIKMLSNFQDGFKGFVVCTSIEKYGSFC